MLTAVTPIGTPVKVRMENGMLLKSQTRSVPFKSAWGKLVVFVSGIPSFLPVEKVEPCRS